MKLFEKVGLLKKVAIAILMVIIVEFTIAKPVEAKKSTGDGIGGVLLEPVVALTTIIGDAIVGVLHYSVMGQKDAVEYAEIDASTFSKLVKINIKGAWRNILCPGINSAISVVTIIDDIRKNLNKNMTEGEMTVLEYNDGTNKKKFVGTYYKKDSLPNTLVLPIYTFSAEEIFKGRILLFDVDFFNGGTKEIYAQSKSQAESDSPGYKVKDYTEEDLAAKFTDDDPFERYYYLDGNDKITTSRQNTALELQTVISKWYNSLRNICLVLMMSVLLYVAIRMMLTSLAAEKAKYKQMLVDWVVGMCLLFFLHYIMAFSVTLVKQITKIVDAGVDESSSYVVVLENDDGNVLKDKMTDMGLTDYVNENDIIYPTNLMGKMRLELQLANTVTGLGYAICFMVLVFYTIFFSFTYVKRVIYMAFLTLIAPLVALTYPIDKLNDGQAQGFNKWLKEYIFNLLLQPLHLLLYSILVSSAFEFAGTNILYSLVALGFLIPAEKILRGLFGFEKAGTPPSLAGAAAGAGLFASGMNKLLRNTPKGLPGKGGKGENGGNGEQGANERTPRFNNNFDAIDAISGGNDNGRNNRLNGNDNGTNRIGGNDRENSRLGGNDGTQELDDTGSAWQDYLDNQEDTTLNLNTPNNGTDFNSQDDNIELDDTGNAWQNYLNDQNEYEEDNNNESLRQRAYDMYRQDGYQPNAEGVYFNPNTDDYDVGYDPGADDSDYMRLARQQSNNLQDNANIPEEQSNASENRQEENRASDESSRHEKKEIKGVKGALRAGGSHLLRTTGRKLTQVAPKIPGKAIRFAAGATVGGAAGLTGLAAGIASGNAKNAVTYGAAGVAAGGISGRNVARQAQQVLSNAANSTTIKEMQKGYYGEEGYKQRRQEKQIKEWKKNQEYRKQLEEALGAETANDMYKSGEIDEYLKYDINDVKSIATIHQLQEKGIVDSRKEAIAAHKYANRIGDMKSMTDKKKKEWKDTVEQEVKNAGYNDNQARIKTDRTMDLVNKYYKTKKDF